MQYELAPMEGITGYIYRNAYVKYFGGMDRYYTPFIASMGLNHKELNDVLPEHNEAFLLGETNGESAVWEGPGRSSASGAAVEFSSGTAGGLSGDYVGRSECFVQDERAVDLFRRVVSR